VGPPAAIIDALSALMLSQWRIRSMAAPSSHLMYWEGQASFRRPSSDFFSIAGAVRLVARNEMIALSPADTGSIRIIR
jgi:hypothetical protein